MGFAWDADDVHLRTVAAEWGMEECSTASTPAASEEFVEVRRGPKSLEPRQFRRAVARVNDMSLDRPALSACAETLEVHVSTVVERGVKRANPLSGKGTIMPVEVRVLVSADGA